jgi:hypothetical protein
MIVCWNEEFKSVQDLWEFPRCYAPTVHILRHRLKTLPPEKAVLPAYLKLLDKKYPNIQELHRNCGELLSLSELYRRLGLIYRGRKVTPEMAVFERQWDILRSLPRSGSYYNILG